MGVKEALIPPPGLAQRAARMENLHVHGKGASQGEAAISKTSVSSFRQLVFTEQASQVMQW